MRYLLLIPVLLILFVVYLVTLTGCSDLPSMKYCDEVKYERKGNEIIVVAHCLAPVGLSSGIGLGAAGI